MAGPLHPLGWLADLRALEPGSLESLLEEEAGLLREAFHWQVSPVGPETRGIAWVSDAGVQGYMTLALKGPAALAGTLFASRSGPAEAVEWALLQAAVIGSFALPTVARFSGEFLLLSKETEHRLLTAWPGQVRFRSLMAVPWLPSGASGEASSGTRLEPWRQEDLPVVARLLEEAYAGVDSDFPTATEAEDILREFTGRQEGRFFEPKASFGAWDDRTGKLLGFVMSCWMAPGVGHIVQLAVAPGQRRRGLAKALLLRALDQLAVLGSRTTQLAVDQTNRGAIALYRTLGFREIHKFPELRLHRGAGGALAPDEPGA